MIDLQKTHLSLPSAADIVNDARHFLDHQVPSPFTVVIRNHLWVGMP